MAFCTQADLELRASALGVQLYGDDEFTDDPVAIATAVDQSLEAGMADIQLYCGWLYSDTALASCTWVKHANVALSLWYYSGRRNESIPPSVQLNYDRVLKVLEKVQAGTFQLPGIALRNKHAPFVTNQRVQMGYRTKKARTERSISTPGPVQHPRNLEMDSEREGQGGF
jgi:hypothetical protein